MAWRGRPLRSPAASSPSKEVLSCLRRGAATAHPNRASASATALSLHGEAEFLEAGAAGGEAANAYASDGVELSWTLLRSALKQMTLCWRVAASFRRLPNNRRLI